MHVLSYNSWNNCRYALIKTILIKTVLCSLCIFVPHWIIVYCPDIVVQNAHWSLYQSIFWYCWNFVCCWCWCPVRPQLDPVVYMSYWIQIFTSLYVCIFFTADLQKHNIDQNIYIPMIYMHALTHPAMHLYTDICRCIFISTFPHI